MKKQEYIEKAKTAILNRIRFHAPIVFDDKVDKTVLFVNGVNIEYPIFKFDKILNKRLVKAFELAKKEEKFNLLLSSSSLGNLKERNLKNLSDTVVYNQQYCPVKFVEMINKLNINYQASSNYNLVFKDKYFKINGQILNPKFEEFKLKQNFVLDNIYTRGRDCDRIEAS